MAQKNPIIRDYAPAVEAARIELEKLAAAQGVEPILEFDLLRADFWPEDESVDDFVIAMRERRRASGRRNIE